VSVGVVEIVEVAGIKDPAIADVGVANVNPLDEAAAATEPGVEWFTIAQREPPDTEIKTSAEKTNERRTVDGRPNDRARAPAPSVPNV